MQADETEEIVPATDTNTPVAPDTVLDTAREALSEISSEHAASALEMIRARVGDEQFKESFFKVLSVTCAGGKERPRFRQVGKFLRDIGVPPPMLVNCLLPDHSLILLSGPPKGGKTYAALDLADSMTTGSPIWGMFTASRQGPVAYLLMEDGEYEGANRLLKRGIRLDDPRPLFVCTDRIILSHIENLTLYEEMIAELEAEAGAAPVLYVIDTAREGLGIKDWNDPAEVADKLRPIREFARRRGTVILIAHNKKGIGTNEGDEISGTNSFTSSVDGWISMKRIEAQKATGNRRMWLSIVGRGNMNGEICIEMDSKTFHFRHVTEEMIEEERREANASKVDIQTQRIAEAIHKSQDGKATVDEIAVLIGDQRENVRRDVQDAVNSGYMEDTGEKKSGHGRRASYYRLTEKGKRLIVKPAPSSDPVPHAPGTEF